AFCVGRRQQFWQPCQKHPSTNIARRSFLNRKSGHPRTELSCMTQPENPDLTSADLSFHSVERFPRLRIADIVLLRTAFDTRSMSRIVLEWISAWELHLRHDVSAAKRLPYDLSWADCNGVIAERSEQNRT